MQNEKDDNRRTRKEQTHNQTDRKKSRKKDAKKTRPDSPASDESDVDRKDPGQTRRKKTKRDPLAELFASEEFRADLRRIAELLEKETESGLTIGALAHKWIGDNRYSRILNAQRFAEGFTICTGRSLTGDMVRYYRSAHQEREFHQKCGKRFDNLGVGHLAAISQTRCKDDKERLRLAELADSRQAKVRQIKHLALRVHKETDRANRLVDVKPTKARVKKMEAVEFLHALDDRSVECAICDWQWSDVKWGQHAEFPDVHCPADPAAHLANCITILSQKLAKIGLIFIFDSPVGILDRRIEDAWKEVGFAHAGKVIWRKSCGAFVDSHSAVANAHEEVHILRFEDHIPKPANGYVSSVTPKWAAPTNAHSGKQGDAVHRFQKPVDLMDLLISIATINGLVVDPFAGSGSAGIAAVRRGCSYAGAELVKDYVDIANMRIALATDETGQVMDAINFFYESATPEQAAVITAALEKSGLHVATRGGES